MCGGDDDGGCEVCGCANTEIVVRWCQATLCECSFLAQPRTLTRSRTYSSKTVCRTCVLLRQLSDLSMNHMICGSATMSRIARTTAFAQSGSVRSSAVFALRSGCLSSGSSETNTVLLLPFPTPPAFPPPSSPRISLFTFLSSLDPL